MGDRPYTSEDLRAEAASQHQELTQDPDHMGIGEAMDDDIVTSTEATGRQTWGELLPDHKDFGDAQDAISDLIGKAADVSAWAVNLGADGLQPLNEQITLDAGSQPLCRIHFAVRPDMPEEMRNALVEGIGMEIAKYLPNAEDTAVAISSDVAAHFLFQERLGGWPPSTFATKLLNLWTSADTNNAERLAVAFPEYAAAIALMRSGQPGIDQLRAIAGDS